MINDDRKYGFKHIDKQYSWMTPGWIDELINYEKDEDVRYHISSILSDLTIPEKSRLESCTDNFDCLEDYCFNRLSANGLNLKEDRVYYWLQVSIDFFAKNEAYELCYNIKRAIEIINNWLRAEEIQENHNVDEEVSDLPF